MFAWRNPQSNAWQDRLMSSVGKDTLGIDSLLLTGATGFIGGNLLVTLIDAGLANRMVCLVRGVSVADALARLRVSALRCGLPHSRVHCITEANVMVGELGSAFSEIDQARLAKASHVINCAALASFSTNPQVADTNVRDTLRFASRFTGSRKLRRFLHVSTAMACGTRCGTNVQESPFDHDDTDHLVPYTRSKREVERLLRVTFPDLPLVVVRPSIVVGHTVLGTLPSASIFWMFRVVHSARRFTAQALKRLDVVSADDCARALMLLAIKPTLAFDTYHVSAGARASTIGQIFGAMDDATGTSGGRYSMCGVRDFGKIARDVVGRDRSGSGRLIEHALRLYAGFAELDYAFDNRRLRDEIGFEPLPFTDYVDECVRTSRGVGIVEQMRWDFK